MKDKIEKLIAEWEDITVGTMQTTVSRTAAVISAVSDVPEPVLEALAQIDKAASGADKLSEINRIREELLKSGAVPEGAKSILASHMKVEEKSKAVVETHPKAIYVVVQYLHSLL